MKRTQLNPLGLLVMALLLLLLSGSAYGQHRATRIRVNAQKGIKIQKKWRLTLQQTVQIAPDFSELLDQGVRDSEFDEIDFEDSVLISSGAVFPEKEENDDSEEGNDDEDESDDDQDDDDETDDADDDDHHHQEEPDPIEVEEVQEQTPVIEEDNEKTNEEESSLHDWLMDDLNFRSMTNLDLSYRLNKQIRLVAGYAYTLRSGKDSHRIFADLRTSHKLEDSKIRLSNRLRWQSSARVREADHIIHYARFRSRIRANWKPIAPYLDGELLYRVNGEKSRFRSYRIGTGLDIRINRSQKIRLAYLYQQRIKSDRFSHTFNLEYRITL